GRRGGRVGAALLAIAVTGSLALPVAARGRGGELPLGARRVSLTLPPPRESPHVTVLLLDGASLDYIWPRVAAGRLPNFGRLLDGGASMDLATIRPTQVDPVWAAVATGMYPAKNGVRSGASYFVGGDDSPVDLLPDHCFSHTLVRLGIVRGQPNSSAAWRARPLWTIVNDYGIIAGIVRWPLTYPVQPITGFLVSDRFHQVIGSIFEFDGRAAYPADLLPAVRDSFQAVAGEASDATRTDASYSRATRDLMAQHPVQLAAVRYQGLDAAGHAYQRQPLALGIGDTAEREEQRYGMQLDRYYAYIDGEIGAAADRLAPGGLLLIVSGFGMRPVGALKHIAARLLRDPDVRGTHEDAPDGFLLAYGTPVAPGRKQRGSIVDVTPTILYFLGIPIGRDMDGYARADVFTRAFTAERPITFIPSHGR
ncbi:MAG TPA: alkaline phosphatase family protein, partial [Vicinamibacterales bacterium]|nr:alkaline phosphatase family protein [Vicinamibacterales bacterium]